MEEVKKMDEERRTLWLEEEKRRNALMEAEEKHHEKRREEEQTRRQKHAEEEEERRKLFWMEVKDAQDKMQESMQARLQEVNAEMMAFIKAALSKKKKFGIDIFPSGRERTRATAAPGHCAGSLAPVVRDPVT